MPAFVGLVAGQRPRACSRAEAFKRLDVHEVITVTWNEGECSEGAGGPV